ncbi:MAG: DUF4870 domain-containing protein [Demequinaceae bacterium]|nr:DUF4870 domain-containing protein [Demequinaceae bacterium]
MAYQNLGGPDKKAAGVAQLGAIIGPLIPYLVWLNRRNEEPISARDAAAATNFGTFVLAAFLPATVVRLYLPWLGWVGAIFQVAIVLSAVVLCFQAYGSVRRGVPAEYPVEISVLRV